MWLICWKKETKCNRIKFLLDSNAVSCLTIFNQYCTENALVWRHSQLFVSLGQWVKNPGNQYAHPMNWGSWSILSIFNLHVFTSTGCLSSHGCIALILVFTLSKKHVSLCILMGRQTVSCYWSHKRISLKQQAHSDPGFYIDGEILQFYLVYFISEI